MDQNWSFRRAQLMRLAAAAAVVATVAMPGVAFAAGSSRPCRGSGSNACQVPEVPVAVILPAAGAAIFGATALYRSRSRVKNTK